MNTPELQHIAQRKLRILWRRVSVTHHSIALCTCSALLVCTVIVGMFVEGFWTLDISTLIVGLFFMPLVDKFLATQASQLPPANPAP